MAMIDDLALISITQMSQEDGMKHILKIRSARRVENKKKREAKTKSKSKKKSQKSDPLLALAAKSPDQLANLIAKLEGMIS